MNSRRPHFWVNPNLLPWVLRFFMLPADPVLVHRVQNFIWFLACSHTRPEEGEEVKTGLEFLGADPKKQVR